MNDFEKGIQAERERVQGLMAMKRDSRYSAGAVQECLDDAITKGKNAAEAAAMVIDVLTRSTTLAELENPPDFDASSGVQTATGEVGFATEDEKSSGIAYNDSIDEV